MASSGCDGRNVVCRTTLAAMIYNAQVCCCPIPHCIASQTVKNIIARQIYALFTPGFWGGRTWFVQIDLQFQNTDLACATIWDLQIRWPKPCPKAICNGPCPYATNLQISQIDLIWPKNMFLSKSCTTALTQMQFKTHKNMGVLQKLQKLECKINRFAP